MGDRPCLAIDPGTRAGWALWIPEGCVTHLVLGAASLALDLPRGRLFAGEADLSSSGKRVNPAERLAKASDWLRQIMRSVAHGRGEVVYEQPAPGRGLHAIRVAYHLEAALLLAVRSMGVTSLSTCAPMAVKKAVTEDGRASKAEVAQALGLAFGVRLQEGDMADAMGVLVAHKSQDERWPG